MGGVKSKSASSCKSNKATSIVPNSSHPIESKAQSTTTTHALDALESGTSAPPLQPLQPLRSRNRPPPPNLTPKEHLQRLQQVRTTVVQVGRTHPTHEDVVTSGPLLLQRLSLAAVQKEKQALLHSHRHRHAPPLRDLSKSAGSQLPRSKLIGLALRKYFRDADHKQKGYLNQRGLRKALSSILKSSKLPSPPDTVTNNVMSFLGSPVNVLSKSSSSNKSSKKHKNKDKKGKRERKARKTGAGGGENGGPLEGADAGAAPTTTPTTKTKYIVQESTFTSALRYGTANTLSNRPPIVVLVASLVDMQFDQRIRYIDRLWKMYMVPRNQKMGYEELHEMLKHLAPEPRHVPTIDETCMFLGAIKRGSSSTQGEEEGGDEEDLLQLTVWEFTEYIMRGLYQTKRSRNTFSSRGPMQAKITRCLNALSEEAAEDHVTRRQSLSRLPSAQLPKAGSVLMQQFARMESMEGKGDGDAT